MQPLLSQDASDNCALSRESVGVTVCVKLPLCRRSSQCDRSSGPQCSSRSKSIVGVCEVCGKIGEEDESVVVGLNMGKCDMTRG